MSAPTELDTVTLCGGLTVPLTAVRLLWELEERGFSLIAQDGGLVVRPKSKLTAADDTAIRAHRDELLSLVRYCDEGVQ